MSKIYLGLTTNQVHIYTNNFKQICPSTTILHIPLSHILGKKNYEKMPKKLNLACSFSSIPRLPMKLLIFLFYLQDEFVIRNILTLKATRWPFNIYR